MACRNGSYDTATPEAQRSRNHAGILAPFPAQRLPIFAEERMR
jgi:hypothetical protein